ncbi:MAG: polyprenyl synthetase family protein [Bacteroidetes bacterium]|nr:polyprenyl synthetase family protein [Bacteroidota bacterium]
MTDKFYYFLEKTEKELEKEKFEGLPLNLYEPLNYIISLGGKRIRPVMVFTGNDIFSGNVENAVSAAIASEFFHNFSLIHDDIMDKAPLRRGKTTVHCKWNNDTAILSGDLMLVKAYQILAESDKIHLQDLLKIFSKTAAQVCEGQQLDMNFETSQNVSENEYLEMIKLKTSVLLGCSLQMGAITANAHKTECEKIYNIGINLGMGFQLMDDYLDTFGNPKLTGKQCGGDIISAKKTLLYIIAAKNNKDFIKIINSSTIDNAEKIEKVKEIYINTKSDIYLKNLSQQYFESALILLNELKTDESKKATLRYIVDLLQNRKN